MQALSQRAVCGHSQTGNITCTDTNLKDPMSHDDPLWQNACLIANSLCLQVEQPVVGQDLLPLASLQGLQELAIEAPNGAYVQPLLSAQLAAGLTSLAALYLGSPVNSLVHVSSLRGLTKLTMSCRTGAEQELGAGEWAAVGRLSGLVQLHLQNAKMINAREACRGALSKLQRLQFLGAGFWRADVLTALTGCAHLTELAAGERQRQRQRRRAAQGGDVEHGARLAALCVPKPSSSVSHGLPFFGCSCRYGAVLPSGACSNAESQSH